MSIVLNDTYFYILIHLHHYRFLSFFVSHQAYSFCSLPFGLSMAPRIFTKCMVPVAVFLRTQGILVFPCIEDWLLVAHSKNILHTNIAFTLQLLLSLGLQVNMEKYHLVLSQAIHYIGAFLDATSREILLFQPWVDTTIRSAQKLIHAHHTSSVRPHGVYYNSPAPLQTEDDTTPIPLPPGLQ